MAKNYSFGRSFNIGKVAVEKVTAFLQQQPNHRGFANVEDVKKYQELGIDILWWIYSTPRNRMIKVEVKADTYFHTGNIYLETVSNMTKQTPGCFLSSRADIWAYFFIGVEVLYWIPLKVAQNWLKLAQNRFQIRNTSTGKGDTQFYQTQGVLVPRTVLLQEVPGVREIKIGG